MMCQRYMPKRCCVRNIEEGVWTSWSPQYAVEKTP